jgi:hypothetical protein
MSIFLSQRPEDIRGGENELLDGNHKDEVELTRKLREKLWDTESVEIHEISYKGGVTCCFFVIPLPFSLCGHEDIIFRAPNHTVSKSDFLVEWERKFLQTSSSRTDTFSSWAEQRLNEIGIIKSGTKSCEANHPVSCLNVNNFTCLNCLCWRNDEIFNPPERCVCFRMLYLQFGGHYKCHTCTSFERKVRYVWDSKI